MFATFPFVPGKTLVHRLDPRAKLLIVIVAIASTGVVDDVRILVGLLVLGLGYFRSAGLPARVTWKAWAAVLLFSFLFLGVINTILMPYDPRYIQSSHPAFSLPRITVPFAGTFQRTVTWEVLFVGLARMLRPLIMMATILPFVFTTNPRFYGVMFRKLGLPDRIAFAMDLSLRYVPTIARDYFSTVDAQRARGYELERRGAGLITLIRRSTPLIVPVVIHAVAGGEQVVEAMELRAFGTVPRAWAGWAKLRFQSTDYGAVVLGVGLVVALGLFRLLSIAGAYWFPRAWFD